MKTLAQTFLDIRDGLTRSKGGAYANTPDLLTLFDRTREAYLAQQDVPASDTQLVPQLFASLRALVAAKPTTSIVSRSASRNSMVQPDPGPSPTITATIAVMTAVLIASIGLGTLTLSIVLAGALGVLGYLAAGGNLWGFSPWRRISKPGAPVLEQRRAAEQMPGADRLEAALRQADALLAQLRDARPVEATPRAEREFNSHFLAFLQDLAEAGAEGDGDHLVALASRRLPSLIEALGLHFATLTVENQAFFAVDQFSDAARKGAAVTIRPAIVRGERCLLRGYARRYV